MKTVIAIMMMAAVMGAGPATQPATRPATQAAFDSAKQKLEDASRGVVELKVMRDAAAKNAEAKFRASKENAIDEKDVEAKLKALNIARLSGTTQDKVDASSSYNAARKKAEADKDQFMQSDTELVSAQRIYNDAMVRELMAKESFDDIDNKNELAMSRAAAQKKEQEEANRIATDPKYAAMKHGQVILGMTSDQVQASARIAGLELACSVDQYSAGGKDFIVATYTQGGITINPGWYNKIIVTNGIVTSVVGFKSSDFQAVEVR